MRPLSLVARLTATVAAIIVISFAAWAAIVHRSTAATYRQVQRDVRLETGPRTSVSGQLSETLGGAWANGGWDAVRRLVGDLTRDQDGAVPSFMILDAEGRVAAATDAGWEGARAHAAADGTLTVTRDVRRGAAMERLELTTTAAATLAHQGVVWGQLVRLPVERDPGADAGAEFAARFWGVAAIWLAGVVVVATAATAWVIRRSILPIDRLTRAARALQSGAVPARLEREGTAELRELIDAFNAATESVARADRQRRDLISDISHELRTPLTNIKAQLEALEQGLIPPDQQFLATVQDETRLLERLVRDLHELALADSGQLSLEMHEIPLRESIEHCVAPLALQAGAAHEISGPTGLLVRADEERLRQVLSNLLENAVRHRPDGLAIEVVVYAEDRAGVFEFRDNGPGVAPEDQPYVFDRFYRADKSRNRRTGGAGLGLAIVSGLLDAMGGSIEYDPSRPGATFRVRLPRP